MPTSEDSQNATLRALPLTDADTVGQHLTGLSNLLVAARPAWVHAARQLRSLLDGAPTLQQTLRATLLTHLDTDPSSCGLHHNGHQVTMMTLAARLLASPVFGNAFTTWSTWGFNDATAQSEWTGNDWTLYLNPLVNGLNLQALRDYWEGRMPGTTISRQKHASALLRQHFLSSLDIAFGIGKLGIEGWKQGQAPELRHAKLQWRLPTGTLLTSTAALALAPQPGDCAWLIYIPGISNAILRFEGLESMRDWILLNRSWVWPATTPPVYTGTRDDVVITILETDGFEALLEAHVRQCQATSENLLLQACEPSETGPLDWSNLQSWEAKRNSTILEALAPATEAAIDEVAANDNAMAQEEAHFAHLEQYLPSAWRQDQITYQQTLLERYLDEDTAPTSTGITLLRERQDQLNQSQDELDHLLLELPDLVTHADLLVLKGEEPLAQQVSDKLCQGLLQEAFLQNTLGDLSTTHLQWVEALVDRPEPSLQRPVQASTLELVVGDHKWQLCGYMVFRALPNDDEAPDDSLLLYRPGQRGGLMAFNDAWQLAKRLLATLQGAWPDALLESAVPADDSHLLNVLSSSTAITFKHTPIPSHFMRDCVEAVVTSLPTDTTREQARQRLCISENRARALAMARFAEQNRTEHIQQQLPLLLHLDHEQRTELALQVETMRESLYASGKLLKGLPTQQSFSRAVLHEHLRNTFKLPEVPQIILDIADSVTMTKEVTGQSATGGAAARDVPVYSKKRSDVALETFMLWALDDDRRLLLENAVVKFSPSNSALLRTHITPSYIVQMIEQLDVAGSYERRIVEMYQGAKEASAWEVQMRLETLRAPYEACLKALALTRPTSLRSNGQRLLEKFCHEQISVLVPRTISYHTLKLRPGTAADASNQSVGLSDIYVIKARTGPVLLYLPNAPVKQVIYQYDTAEAACEALQRMALDSEMTQFLAMQADAGDPAEHESYIKTALAQGFHSFIALGQARTEPMPTHQYHLDMGERIRIHRATSRSQADLALSAPDTFDRHFFMGLNLALRFVPGAGTAIAAYDGWHAANAAVRAFGRGAPDEGLQHLVSLLQSLTDAIVSLAPLGASTKPAPSARQLTLQRQRTDPFRRAGGIRKPRPDPFAGYEIEPPLGSLQHATHARGTGVLKLAGTEHHYISRNSTWYAVGWDSTYSTWRLKPQGTRNYRQPVQFSELGTWETPGRLSGLLVENGLAGGGGVLTRLHDQGIALWRTALRRQPLQLTGLELAHDINDELKRIVTRMKVKQSTYQKFAQQAETQKPLPASLGEAIAKARTELIEEINSNIEYNSRSITRLRDQRTTLSRADLTKFVALCEENINEMSVLEMNLTAGRFSLANDRVLLATQAVKDLPGQTAPATVVRRLAQDLQKANLEVADTLREIEQIALRHHNRLKQLQGDTLVRYMKNAKASGLVLDVTNARLVQASIRSAALFNASAVEHPQMGAFMPLFNEQGGAFRSKIYSHVQLPEAGLSRTQERHFLTNAQRHYQSFLNHLTAWEDNFKGMIVSDQSQSFRHLMQQLIDEIEDSLSNATIARRPNVKPGTGPSRPRLFETEEGPLIGTEFSERGQRRMRINRPDSQQAHTTYALNASDQWQVIVPERTPPTQTLPDLLRTAQERLSEMAKQKARLHQYKTADAIPVDLEDIAQGHAQPLRFLAGRIREKAGKAISNEQVALVNRLEASADEMHILGQQLRIEQTKATARPTAGHLEYLVEQQEVEIAWSRTLNPKMDRKGKPVEYLEEYRVNDRLTRQPLWYAHFHFRQRPAQGFTRLEAGHLKLPGQRDLGVGAWRGTLSETQANRLFGNLRPASN